jgi:pimeloyl-ACP methyl ester carboxylesterase
VAEAGIAAGESGCVIGSAFECAALVGSIRGGRSGTLPGPRSMSPPETRYAKSGDVNIAYQVVGDGPIDVVFVMGWVSHIELFWAEPSFARFLRRLASVGRLILFDKRGTGLSDRVPHDRLPTLEQRMDDVRAVLDAVGSERAALLGVSEGGPMCALFAATYPERTRALVMIGGYARLESAPDYPWGERPQDHDWERLERDWGGDLGLVERAPSMAHDDRFRRWWASYLRLGASPGAVVALSKMNVAVDIRDVLPVIAVPTLVLHRVGDRLLPVEGARYVAERIPGARLVELPGEDHLPFAGDQDAMLDEIEEFLTGSRSAHEPERALATLLFTDVVGSTERVAELGDRRWRELLEAHNAAVRRELDHHRGRELSTAGDGFLAMFDGPIRAMRAALAIVEAVRELGLEVRAGIHTGEVELMGKDIGGLAVHIGARVSAAAGPGEVLVSRTVTDLVAGSGLQFEDRGPHTLKGVPGEWRLFRVIA